MRLTWDDAGSHKYEAGVDRGVFFPKTGPGVAWNGLTSVKEYVENDGPVVTYVDGQKIVNQLKLGSFAADISAITYPDEMLPYDGYQDLLSGQKRDLFNLSYRSLIGNDSEGLAYGYRLHLIFNCFLAPTNRSNDTLNRDPVNSDFQWKLTTTPVATPYHRATSHFIIESPNIEARALIALESLLYGQDGGVNSTFPTVAQLLGIFEANAIFTVVDNGDGTATVTGPDDWVFSAGTNLVSISSPSFNQIDDIRILATSY